MAVTLPAFSLVNNGSGVNASAGSGAFLAKTGGLINSTGSEHSGLELGEQLFSTTEKHEYSVFGTTGDPSSGVVFVPAMASDPTYVLFANNRLPPVVPG